MCAVQRRAGAAALGCAQAPHGRGTVACGALLRTSMARHCGWPRCFERVGQQGLRACHARATGMTHICSTLLASRGSEPNSTVSGTMPPGSASRSWHTSVAS